MPQVNAYGNLTVDQMADADEFILQGSAGVKNLPWSELKKLLDVSGAGTLANFLAKTDAVAGAAISQFDVLYAKNVGGQLQWFPYDGAGADKNEPARAMAMEAIAYGDSGLILFRGIVTNAAWRRSSLRV